MKQLTQNLKNGKMELLEVPFPALNKNSILVRNHYSVISAGTEGKTVKDARLGYIGKAMERQKEVKQVIETAKTQGIKKTYDMVMNKLDAPSALGYSCAGEVIQVGEAIDNIKVGDYAACGGAGANHSEVVSISKNLFVKVPQNVDLKYAAFATVGSIAMQGIRQADLRLGENCVVIGLGLIGQLTIQLLNAAGVKPIGIDIDPKQVEAASNIIGSGIAIERNRDDLENIVLNATNVFGTDAVIITAGSSSLDPVELAGILCRKKGKVIIVGSVPTGFSRKNYYQKELDLRMSSSYGPGRYDLQYEEKGIDYPAAYVRWTENRNMQAFIELISSKQINLEKIITHEFKFENAPAAYDLILRKEEPFSGIILKYDVKREIRKQEIVFKNNQAYQTNNPNNHSPKQPTIGFIGAGSFAQNMLLPNIKGYGDLIGVSTARGNNARNIADKYKFKYAAGSADEILNDENINTIFIATRHNLHAEYVLKALGKNKNVFVEKPLCMNEEELQEIVEVYRNSPDFSFNKVKDKKPPPASPFSKGGDKEGVLMVGFNRRFAPHIKKIKEIFPSDEPKAINYRINAGTVPPEHWTQDKEIGGGRIIGEVCHFIDLAMFIAGSKIKSISANIMDTPLNLMDTLSVNLSFENGSIASISYFSNGNKSVKKEYLEVYYANQIAVMDDFKEMIVYGKKEKKFKLSKQDKGHAEEVKTFLNAVKNGSQEPIPFEEQYLTTLAAFKVIESIRKRETILI